MKTSIRLYHCARCHAQVLICSKCDRSQIYCASTCSTQARRESLLRAAKKYRQSHRGRLASAKRQHAYRERQRKKVTHQGSPPTPCSASLQSLVKVLLTDPKKDQQTVKATPLSVLGEVAVSFHCHFCQESCDDFFRLDFLHRGHCKPHFRCSSNV